MKDVVLIGAGGHAQTVLDLIEQSSEYRAIGFLDADPELHGTQVRGLPVLGGDEQLARLAREETRVIIAVGSVQSRSRRQELFERMSASGVQFATLVHPRAIIAPGVSLGAGTIVAAGAIINPRATVGRNVIVNTGAIIEHECSVGDHSHIAPGALLGGDVTVGARSHVGLGAIVLQGISIAPDSTVGAGAVVTHDVIRGETVVGVPARALEDAR